MADEDNKDLEKAFSKRDITLRSFYDSSNLDMTDEEKASLTPILNSLKSDVARYHEIDKIAVGGEKKITLAHDNRLDRRVAMARSVKSDSVQDLEQFLREARLTANLAHPNIMPVYNMGLDDRGEPFFSMELVSGDSLKSIVKKLSDNDEVYRRRYTVENLLSIFMKVCDAVSYAHSRNVLHLDIKPGNIKVGDFGEVFVCDWGLARVNNEPETGGADDSTALDGDVLNDMTLSGTMKGTPGFMAPEQTLAFGEKTPCTDVYALGALLYMLLTHKLPVEGRSANEVIQNTREGKVIPIRRHTAYRRVPKGLAAVAMKALAHKPEDRYESVVELRQEISRYLAGHPTHAERAGMITRTSLLLQRHSRVAFLLIFFLILLAMVISGNLVAISREKAEAVAAREKAENHFQLYLKEQKLAQNLEQDLGEAVFYTVRSRDFVSAPSMIQVLQTGLEENIDTVKRKNLLEQKGILHFVLQEFNAADAAFNEAGQTKRIGQMHALSRKYAVIKPEDSMRLTDQQLADLFYEERPPNAMTLYYLYYHHMRRRPVSATPEDYIPLAGAVLDKLNSTKWALNHPLKLEEGEMGRHLNLSRAPYSVYAVSILGVYRRNVLQPLNIYSLDISHTPTDHLGQLHGLKLKELNMAGVKLGWPAGLNRQLRPLKLENVILTRKDYEASVLEQVEKRIRIIDADQKAPKATPASPANAGSPGSAAP
jgi:serine/threonine protein kinase